jgi:hypothetical protein
MNFDSYNSIEQNVYVKGNSPAITPFADNISLIFLHHSTWKVGISRFRYVIFNVEPQENRQYYSEIILILCFHRPFKILLCKFQRLSSFQYVCRTTNCLRGSSLRRFLHDQSGTRPKNEKVLLWFWMPLWIG